MTGKDKDATGTFEDIFSIATPEIRKISEEARKMIVSMHSGYTEIVWPRQRIASYGVGPKKMSEHYVYIAPQKRHVNLGFYHGASLNDPDELLEGTGKNLRHVKLFSLEDVKRSNVKKLVRAAIADRKKSVG